MFLKYGLPSSAWNQTMSPSSLQTTRPEWSLSQQPIRPKAEWAVDSKAMRARGIIVLVKSNQLVKNIETKQLQLVKKSFFAANKSALSLPVGYNIQPSSSSTNQDAALIIDYQLDFTNNRYLASCCDVPMITYYFLVVSGVYCLVLSCDKQSLCFSFQIT